MAAAEVVDPNRLSYDRGPSAPSLLESTIGANLAATAARYGHREALVDMVARRRFNYSELLTDVHRLATGLVRAGIGPGDRVGIWAPNRWEWVLVQYATAEIGAILVTINPAYRVREVEYALRQSGVAMVIAVASFKDADYAAMLAEVGPRCPDLADVILLESDRWDALAGAEPDLPALQQTAARLDGSDPVNIQYTSPAGSKTSSSGAARTSRRGRSRNSSTRIPILSTVTSSGCPTPNTAKSSWRWSS